jgi:AcrR family transcriptional regulator
MESGANIPGSSLEDSKKPYHAGDLRLKLIRAGEEALAEMPVEEVSLREIARRAGVSHAAPKHHFSSMGELLGEIAARGFERFVETLDYNALIAPDQSPETRLTAMNRAYIAFAMGNKAVYGLMFGKKSNLVMTPHLVQAQFTAWEQIEGAVAAIIGRQRAEQGALMVWSSVHGLSMLLIEQRLPPSIDPARTVEQMARMVITALKADQ